MDNILAWMSSTTGIITTFTAFMVAILLFIENSKKLVFRPLSRLGKFLFGWMSKTHEESVEKLAAEVRTFMERSEAGDKELAEAIKGIRQDMNTNECDRIRAEIFNYGRIARNHHPISTEEWRHIQDIYYKYHEVLHGNGQVTEEYEFIKGYYYSQFESNTESGE